MQYLRTLKYGFHVIFHPFDGFWDLKKEHRGSIAASFTFIVLTIFMLVVQKQNTAFLFNMNRLETIDVMVDIVSVGLLCILWCVSNWCLTSLMDGEGKMRDIIIFTGYSLIPLWLIQFPLIGMSHMITAEEGTSVFCEENTFYNDPYNYRYGDPAFYRAAFFQCDPADCDVRDDNLQGSSFPVAE